MIHVRDVYCLISGTFLTTCEAAHIVPKSRPDVSEIGRFRTLEERVAAILDQTDKLLPIAWLHRSIAQYWVYGKMSQSVRCITLQPACYWIPLYTKRSIGSIFRFTTG
jgi:hypothetical protein